MLCTSTTARQEDTDGEGKSEGKKGTLSKKDLKMLLATEFSFLMQSHPKHKNCIQMSCLTAIPLTVLCTAYSKHRCHVHITA